jgi:glycine/D-amino acid oxidase-like deaminating enzyme
MVVVGAGVLGLSVAWHLAKRGATDVTVVDAGPPLSATTPAGAGFVIPAAADLTRDLGNSAVLIHRYSRDFYRDLHERGADIDYAAHGNLVLLTSEASLKASVNGILRHPLVDAETREVSRDEIVSLTAGEVNVDSLAGGVFMGQGSQVTTSLVSTALQAECEAIGVRFVFNAEMTGATTVDGAVTGVTTTAGEIPATTVVLATGAWINASLALVGWQLPLVPTVVTRFVTAPLGLPDTLPTIQSRDLGLWIRNLHGAYSWGSLAGYGTTHSVGLASMPYGRPIVESLITAMRTQQDALAQVFTSLAGAEPEQILQGVPAYTADGRLYAGAVPGSGGVFAIGGDNESGVMHGPGMARLVSDLIFNDEPLIDPSDVSLGRIDPSLYPSPADAARAMAERSDRVATAFDR